MNDRTLMADRLERFLLLTPKKQRIARLFAEGRTMYEVAAVANIRPQTVRNHLVEIYDKLDIRTDGTKCRDLAYLIGFVDGMGSRKLRIVTHRELAA